MLKKINIGGALLVLATAVLLFTVGFKRVNSSNPHLVYQVYLNGNKIGLLEDKEELYDLIDKTQESIKDKFGIDKVYPPQGLKATLYRTFSDNIKSAQEIYNIIEKESTFTVLGYTITITPIEGETKYINILNKDDLEPALLDAVSAFIPTDSLEAYINNNQVEITDTGKTIENVYFDEKITIKENYLSVDSEIITNQSDLTKYLLFGTLEKQAEYKVKDGDTVETVAYNNKLSNEELLIANPSLSSVNSLLSPGQILNIGLINPLFTVVEEAEVIEDAPALYKTIYEEDSTRYASQSYVKQKGQNGVNRLTEKILYKNGEIMTLVTSHTTEISAPVNHVIVRGTKRAPDYSFNNYPPAASSTDWGWPTTSPYVITSKFGYRWGKLHGGIDISGTGFGSPIYSATDGTVIEVVTGCPDQGYYGSPCGQGYGNAVRVRNSAGLIIYYAHIKSNIQVKVGQSVSKGQLLGYMGNSGSSTGTHLHFEIRNDEGTRYDPCKAAFRC